MMRERGLDLGDFVAGRVGVNIHGQLGEILFKSVGKGHGKSAG